MLGEMVKFQKHQPELFGVCVDFLASTRSYNHPAIVIFHDGKEAKQPSFVL